MRGLTGIAVVLVMAAVAPAASAEPSELTLPADTYFELSADSIDRAPHKITVAYDRAAQRFTLTDTAGIEFKFDPAGTACARVDANTATCAGQPATSGISDAIVVEGGAGPDRIDVTSAGPASQFSIIDGDRGNDTLFAPGAGDVRGGDGDDRLFGSPKEDRLHAEGGDDLIVGGKGADKMNGGPGIDLIRAKDGVKDLTIRCFGGSNLMERATRDPFDPPARSC